MYFACNDLHDSTGNLSDLTLHTAGGFGAGMIPGEGAFIATDSGGRLTHAADALLSGYGDDFTVRYVQKLTASSGFFANAVSIGENNADGFDAGAANTAASFEIPGSDESYPQVVGGSIDDGAFHHIVCRWVNSTQTLSIFVDGVKTDQVSAVAGGASDPTNTLQIGPWNGGTHSNIGSVGIWKGTALTDAQCALLYGGGTPLGYADFS